MTPTNWNYTLTTETSLDSLVSEFIFNTMTANKYEGDQRIGQMIEAASAAVRNYCGWHLYPSLDCEYQGDSEDTARIIQLPARYVTAVSSVNVDGVELGASDYAWKTNGLIRLGQRVCSSGWNDITVEYTAGLPEELMGAINELVVHRVTHALAQSYGVQSEAAGGVSITYSANWINGARATALPDDNKEVLEPYRLQGVF